MFTVRETAKLFDISIRTLHFYDSIDLLKPTVVSDAGYRYYDGEAINTLRQIIFLRKLEIPLKDIQNMLYNPDCDQKAVYETQLRILEKRRNEMDNLIDLIKKIVRSEENMETSRDLLKLDVILDPRKQEALHAPIVERPEMPWSGSVRKLLSYLEKQGQPVEHILKVENGIEYAAQFDGDLIHPYKWSDEALDAIGKMLRSLHDASETYPISCDDTWQPWSLRELGGKHRICCHGDFAPWNVLTVNGMPHRIVDWEYAGPMDPFVELARVCWLFVQLHDDDLTSLYNLPSAEKRAQQVRIVCDAYGISADMRAKLVEQIMEVVMNECAYGSTGITFEDEGSLWFYAWRTRSLYWIWRNREVLNTALD